MDFFTDLLLTFFGKECNCPYCGRAGARTFWLVAKCRNPNCSRYNIEYAQRFEIRKETGQSFPPTSRPAPSPGGSQALTSPLSGTFDAGANRMDIHYRNFSGQEKTFTGDRRTLRDRKKHISVCIAPTGRRVALAKERILNRDEVESQVPPASLTGIERQVLAYHRKRGSTSPRFEAIQRKYPGL
jgi:hypothetical protein